MTGRLYGIGVGPGDPDLITLKALRLLTNAAVIAYPAPEQGESLEEGVRELRAIRKDVLIYGEPWTAGDTTIEPTLKGAQRAKGFSVFDDHFRDALTGAASWLEPGYVQSARGVESVKKGIQCGRLLDRLLGKWNTAFS